MVPGLVGRLKHSARRRGVNICTAVPVKQVLLYQQILTPEKLRAVAFGIVLARPSRMPRDDACAPAAPSVLLPASSSSAPPPPPLPKLWLLLPACSAACKCRGCCSSASTSPAPSCSASAACVSTCTFVLVKQVLLYWSALPGQLLARLCLASSVFALLYW